jgi:hypothetical protein
MSSPPCLLRALCVLLFPILLLQPSGAAEILALTVIHDGSIDPPGFKVEATLRFPPEQQEAALEVAVARLTKADPPDLEPVKSKSDKLRDAEGNYLQQTPIKVELAPGKMSRLVTTDLVIAYRDLALDPGEHQIAVQARLSGPGFQPVLAISDLVRVSVSKATRVLESPTEPGDLMRWQQPKVFARPKEIARSVLPLAARTIAGGFASKANDAQERQFFAEAEIAEFHSASSDLPPVASQRTLHIAIAHLLCR